MSSSKGTLLFPTSAYLSLFFSIFPLLMILDQTLKEFCKVKIPHCLSVGTEHLKLPVQRQKKSNEDSRTSGLQCKAQSIPAPSQGRRQNCNYFNHPSICHILFTHYRLGKKKSMKKE